VAVFPLAADCYSEDPEVSCLHGTRKFINIFTKALPRIVSMRPKTSQLISSMGKPPVVAYIKVLSAQSHTEFEENHGLH